MKTVKALCRYSLNGASSRVRFELYREALAKADFDLVLSPLFSYHYLTSRYLGHTLWIQVFFCYMRRLCEMLLQLLKRETVWVEKELWPWAPYWLEALLLLGKKVALDLDDATFHSYDQHPSRLVRLLYGRKIDRLMRRADLVTAGNDYIASRAKSAGARWVEVLPTVVDTVRYQHKATASVKEVSERVPLVVIWIGSPSTEKYLGMISVAMREASALVPIEIRVIGGRFQLEGVSVKELSWNENTEVESIQGGDVGIMPLMDSPWERGKCGYKLIQYMACGLAVIASPVGVNKKIVRHGLNGFLAATPQEWRDSLLYLAKDARSRQSMGTCGRKDVESKYSLEVNAPRLCAWLHQLIR